MRKRERVPHKNKAKQPNFAVQQAPKADADINTMIQRHMAGPGRMGYPIGNPHATRRPSFLEVPAIDLQTAMNLAIQAKNQFAALPARVKGRFDNNPVTMLHFIQDPKNREEATKLGFFDPVEPKVNPPTSEDFQALTEALKADPEANPSFKGGTPKTA